MKTFPLKVEPTGESNGHCNCCGHESRTAWGSIASGDALVACYFVQWTRGQVQHHPNLDFLIGNWGDDTQNDRVLVSWEYSASRHQFMLIDGASRPAARSALCSQALNREQVLSNQSLLQMARNALDAVWLGDARIEEIKASPDT